MDIIDFKRQQRLLARANRSARDSAARLREKSIVLEATLENMDQGVAKISATGVVELCNSRALELLDLPGELMASRPTLAEVLTFRRARGEFEPALQEVRDLRSRLRHVPSQGPGARTHPHAWPSLGMQQVCRATHPGSSCKGGNVLQDRPG